AEELNWLTAAFWLAVSAVQPGRAQRTASVRVAGQQALRRVVIVAPSLRSAFRPRRIRANSGSPTIMTDTRAHVPRPRFKPEPFHHRRVADRTQIRSAT